MFARLAEVQAECARIREQAGHDAEQVRERAREQAAGLIAQARERAEGERAEVAALAGSAGVGVETFQMEGEPARCILAEASA